jgi:hypothetical protein
MKKCLFILIGLLTCASTFAQLRPLGLPSFTYITHEGDTLQLTKAYTGINVEGVGGSANVTLLKLPTTPPIGTYHIISNNTSDNTNAVVIAATGSNKLGGVTSGTLNLYNNQHVTLKYVGGTAGWNIEEQGGIFYKRTAGSAPQMFVPKTYTRMLTVSGGQGRAIDTLTVDGTSTGAALFNAITDIQVTQKYSDTITTALPRPYVYNIATNLKTVTVRGTRGTAQANPNDTIYMTIRGY